MVKYVQCYHSDNNTDILTTAIINKTIMTFISVSFKLIKTSKQPTLLPCPQGCEKSSEFWFSWISISLLLSGILIAIITIKTLEEDHIDQKHALVEEIVRTDKRRIN
ncbi:hypothetical protein LOAG_02733 [Loa loa]|uniref:Uncharacterized protein n=1 Tax=Loa loa TaxID=7209 RepID=A0A1S0U6C3_LOALO|nr:hypothetical protein LOAG_02733 [Loa loa]EFO25749.1 hypothetical protein LOAG_02733 [Loa loa]